MHFIPGNVYHIYNRGNNKQPIFFSERNYEFFLQKIKTQLCPSCELLCWCLMPNHFHLLVYATEKTCMERPSFGGKPMQELPYRIGVLLSSYSQAINKQNGTIGSLFQQKTKSKCISDGEINYLVTCVHYIHQNPCKAKLVDNMVDWRYSSFREHMGVEVCVGSNTGLLLSLLGCDRSVFCRGSSIDLDGDEMENIW